MRLHGQQQGDGRLHRRQGAVQGVEELREGHQRGGDELRGCEQRDVQEASSPLLCKEAA